MNAISQQNPVRIFVAHPFEEAEDYLRVFEYLESSHNFYYRNVSVPDRKFQADPEGARTELRRQIGLSEVVIIPAGLYKAHRDWVEFELNCAKGFDKPVIVLELFGVKEKLPVQLEALSDERIEWNERSIADAIRRQARHEDTARWDVIDFKLD
ncbi:MAG: TIR domain-containing protein [Steroidobacteraceae bacterium]